MSEETSWADECEEPDSSTPPRGITYVFARRRAKVPPALIVLSPTRRGWASRSTMHDAFNHDYVSYESIDDVLYWIHSETRCHVTIDREEVLASLTIPYESSGVLPTGYLECDPMMSPPERAEAALRHLELC